MNIFWLVTNCKMDATLIILAPSIASQSSYWLASQSSSYWLAKLVRGSSAVDLWWRSSTATQWWIPIMRLARWLQSLVLSSWWTRGSQICIWVLVLVMIVSPGPRIWSGHRACFGLRKGDSFNRWGSNQEDEAWNTKFLFWLNDWY